MARHLRVVVAVLVGLVLSSAEASAREDDSNVHASSDSNGVDVIITASDEAASHAPGNSSTSACHWTATLFYDDHLGAPDVGPPPTLDHKLYLVYCDGQFVGVYWLGPRNLGLPDTTAMAGQVVDHVPVDLATIAARPSSRAVTGITSYFWVQGYSGAPINETVSGFGVNVAVSVTLGSVVWDFGDGTPPVSGGLGEPWPARSSVRHTYRDKGLHTVTVTITMPAQFTVNGGVVQQLPPVVRTATLAYQVDEVQAVRNR